MLPAVLTHAGRPLHIQAFLGLTFPICEMSPLPASKFYESLISKQVTAVPTCQLEPRVSLGTKVPCGPLCPLGH